MSDVPADDAPAPDKDKSTRDGLADALSPVVAPESTDEERFKEPKETRPADEREAAD
ncbi:hypothetical protein [Arthrobacter sp. ISL-65]|uniref:hypothetical protein n=1 Tax=Arthrobacter sp. ISL-65 TaxID=2819112 RepID=UPI001BE54AD6|nr:hypothetical protein [Arthrobacter sp. ISL-65]MBT2549679.1 hypothetical protein [Arthrobacter sp. ISL-65]